MTDFKRNNCMLVPFSNLVIREDFNVRYDMGDLEALKISIIENGVLEVMSGYKDGDNYVITNGHRRYKALEMAINEKSLKKDVIVKLMPEAKGYNEEKRVLDIILRNEGKPLTMLEEAMVYQKLISLYGKTVKDLQTQVGKSQKHIDNCLLLLEADTATIKQVKSGKVAASTVIEELRKETGKGGSKVQAAANVKQKVDAAVDKSGGKKVTRKNITTNIPLSDRNLTKLMGKITEAGTVEGKYYKKQENQKAFDILTELISYAGGKIEFEELCATFYK